MNHSKIAAALHALADAFLADVESVEQAVTGKKGSKKTTAAEAVAANPAAAAATPAPVTPAPVVPSITKDQLNKAVLKVAAKSRDVAEAILAKFGAKNTVTLQYEPDDMSHARQKRVLAHAFSMKALLEQEDIVTLHIKKLVANLQRLSEEGRDVDICDWFSFVMFDLTGDLAFKESFGCLDEGKISWKCLKQKGTNS